MLIYLTTANLNANIKIKRLNSTLLWYSITSTVSKLAHPSYFKKNSTAVKTSF